MPILNPERISDALSQEIERAKTMRSLVMSNIPHKFVPDSDEKILVSAFLSLVLEHHDAILYLLQAGQFDGSAITLVRPTIEAAYRAHWAYSSAQPEDIRKVRSGERVNLDLASMARAVEQNLNTGGFFLTVARYLGALNGYTHGGLEHLGRRFDSEGNVRPRYSDAEKSEAIRATTAHLVALAVAWCHVASRDGVNAKAVTISDGYTGLYGTA